LKSFHNLLSPTSYLPIFKERKWVNCYKYFIYVWRLQNRIFIGLKSDCCLTSTDQRRSKNLPRPELFEDEKNYDNEHIILIINRC
jgi:hypothetical protein